MRSKHTKNVLFSLGNETLEQVKENNFLGQMVSAGPNHEGEIRR